MPATSTSPARGRFPVVGIGASAGGLEAFKKLFGNLPNNSGLALVLIPHLDPTHESLMVPLLSKYTAMPVLEAAEGMLVEPDHVYILPPNKYMALKGGALRLSGPVDRQGVQTSIDLFLRSLAADQQELAICIILSGTGAHGSLGLRDVKANGGMAMVQDPATAAYDQMPRNAAATGLADYVLAPEQMPEVLLRYVREFYRTSRLDLDESSAVVNQLIPILTLLRNQSKCDFRSYRKKMIVRRIHRRMSLIHLEELSAYEAYLHDHPEEVKLLTGDLLISVTSFFRDPEAFQVLAREVFPELLQEKDGDTAVRVWVPSCATGEEAYTIGMLLLEQAAASRKNIRIQIFASDVDEDALQTARLGQYPATIAGDISSERLERFFTRVDEQTFQVCKPLREAIVFTAQDLLSDAPFSKLDLISCRNLLIYLEPETQKKIIPLLHFALKDGGFLLLGPSETTGRQTDLFEAVSKKWRVYRRIGPSRPDRVDFPIGMGRKSGKDGRPANLPELRRPNYEELAHQLLLEVFAPAALLINRAYEILYFHGPTGHYLDFPSGEPTQDLLRMARPGLRTKLRAAIHKAVREQRETTVRNIRIKRDGSSGLVKLTVKPVHTPKAMEGLLLIILEEERELEQPPTRDTEAAEGSLEQHLEAELRTAREDLQHSIEELEGSNEELKSSNEEMMSMNEELQSTNEEMETSKEELQSLNEELTTVNSQLQEKIADLEVANNDLSNSLTCTDIATIFLDPHFHIKRFTPSATNLLRLIPTDLDRPIGDIAWKFTDPDLLHDAERVLQKLTTSEKEIQGTDGRWYLRRIVPYRTLADKIEGVVVTFIDVTPLKKASEQMRFLATVLRDSNDAVIVQDFSGRILVWNRGAEQTYGYTEAEALLMKADQMLPPEQRAVTVEVLEKVRRGEQFDSWETHRQCKDQRILNVWVTLTVLKDEAGQPVAVASTERDITKQKLAEKKAQALNAELETRVFERTADLEGTNAKLQAEIAERARAEEALSDINLRLATILNTAADGIIVIDEHGDIDSFNKAAEKLFGYSEAELLCQNVKLLMPSPYSEEHDNYIANYLKTGIANILGSGRQVVAKRKDGSTFPVLLAVSEVRDGKRFFAGILHDLSERREMEREILEAAAETQRRIGQDLHDSVGQELTGLGLMAESLAELISDKSGIEAQTTLKLVAGIRRTLRQVRALSAGLIPVDVDAEGLMAALKDLATRTSELTGRNCIFECIAPVLVEDNTTAVHLYHIAQEAVANALKHGQARHIEITLSADARRLTLTIHDDGVGIPLHSSSPGGMGLKIMQYRAGLINATLTIGADATGGTLIQCVQTRGGMTNNGNRKADV